MPDTLQNLDFPFQLCFSTINLPSNIPKMVGNRLETEKNMYCIVMFGVILPSKSREFRGFENQDSSTSSTFVITQIVITDL